MTTLLLALVMMTGIEAADDGGRLVLTFDAPVVFSQAAATAPSRLILTIEGAGATDELLPVALRAGVTLEQQPAGSTPSRLRVIVPLPDRSTASVSAEGRALVVTMTGQAFSQQPLEGTAMLVATPTASGGLPDPAPQGAAAEDDYVIGPEDLMEINVFELPELKTTTRVLGDGTVSLPLLGVVRAAGLSKTGFESRLRELLEARFLLDPQVTVSVSEYRSKQVSVIGAVTKPGTYQMLGPRTVLQMISEAGGLTKESGADIFIIRRRETGQAERLHLDLEDLVTRGNPELNLLLSPGDVINVPIDRPIYVFVDGAVKTPGQVESKSSRPITLLQAVARAGGLTERANLRGVHILRRNDQGAQTRIPVNLREIRKGKADDIDLEDGDVIVVPETFF